MYCLFFIFVFTGEVRIIDTAECPGIGFSAILQCRESARSFLIADDHTNEICRFYPSFKGGSVDAVSDCGKSESVIPFSVQFAHTSLNYPFEAMSFCADPTQLNRYFVGDYLSIRRSDGETVSPISGVVRFGGLSSMFAGIRGMVCAPDGKTLYVSDSDRHRIRSMDVESGNAKTIAGHENSPYNRDGKGFLSSLDTTCLYLSLDCAIHRPRKLVWYAGSKTVLFITAVLAIRRFDIESGEMTTLQFDHELKVQPTSIGCTSTGILVFHCSAMNGVYAVDPLTANGKSARLCAGGGNRERIEVTHPNGDGPTDRWELRSFYPVSDLCIEETEQRIWMVGGSRIQYLDAPPPLFWPARR
jgi:hypothetical protein